MHVQVVALVGIVDAALGGEVDFVFRMARDVVVNQVAHQGGFHVGYKRLVVGDPLRVLDVCEKRALLVRKRLGKRIDILDKMRLRAGQQKASVPRREIALDRR